MHHEPQTASTSYFYRSLYGLSKTAVLVLTRDARDWLDVDNCFLFVPATALSSIHTYSL